MARVLAACMHAVPKKAERAFDFLCDFPSCSLQLARVAPVTSQLCDGRLACYRKRRTTERKLPFFCLHWLLLFPHFARPAAETLHACTSATISFSRWTKEYISLFFVPRYLNYVVQPLCSFRFKLQVLFKNLCKISPLSFVLGRFIDTRSSKIT